MGLRKTLQICTLILMISFCKNSSGFKITNIRCATRNASLGVFTKCSLKPVKRDVAEINVFFKLVQKPIDGIRLVLRLKRRGDLSKKSLYQYKLDLCAFLRSDRRNPLANLFYSFFEMKRYSNFNHSCPYDHDIILDRCRLNANYLSHIPIAAGEYSVQTNWTLFDEPIADFEIAIKID